MDRCLNDVYQCTLKKLQFLKDKLYKLYHQVDEENGEKIMYYDYTSLYPYISKNAVYPIGHPEIISQPGHTDISRFFGIAKSGRLHSLINRDRKRLENEFDV